jgi:hypothetical protein
MKSILYYKYPKSGKYDYIHHEKEQPDFHIKILTILTTDTGVI